MNNILAYWTTLLAFLILLIALYISASTTVRQMINLYQVQALVLAFLVLLIAFEGTRSNLTLVIVAGWPPFLALIIKPLLRRATLAGPEVRDSLQIISALPLRSLNATGSVWADFWTRATSLFGTTPTIDLLWLQYGRSLRSPLVSISIDLMLTIVAFLVAYRLISSNIQGVIDTNSLAISLALLLLGLFMMSNKRDIISQVVGLLVMEHGLFLAAIKIIAVPTLAVVFVVSLFFYITITLTILLWLLPNFHKVSKSIELEKQKELVG